MKIKWLLKEIGATLWDHRADIEFVVGTGLVATGSVIAMTKAEDAVEVKHKVEYEIKVIELKDENNDWDSKGEKRKECAKMVKDAVVGYTKVYALPIGMQVAGFTLQTISYKTQKAQIATLATNLAAETMAFAAYRQNVINDLGEEKDEEYLLGVEKEIVNEDGKEVEKVYATRRPDHSFLFDETNPNYKKEGFSNLEFLEDHERWLNDRLWTEGFLWENDIRRDVDAPIDPNAESYGITAVDENGNRNYISFGIQKNTERARVFREGTEKSFLIILNNMEPNITKKLYRLNKYHKDIQVAG